ncbi:MAG: hypothetical protein QT08_C0009G0005 [archaeon GW2011_AR17]|nr:MAG: hypothetical protein QT08_C0009G0005 [archaeon GW2011_AR17]MBS3154203.1 hypothetical protein [Candidatus Woesearchaeota archaeon]HIH14759.1 hypothetical protein [Nanoarchaeota archaeon]HIH58689.1 hypothetical protein [Nanoarchaeota archaeon]HII14477.1 hypothetical protein [Nanoarchaeota archaeon]
MNKNWIFAIVLGVLIIVSVVQAVQLSSIKESISEGELSTGSATSTTNTAGSSSSSTSSSSSLSELPSMVGGC